LSDSRQRAFSGAQRRNARPATDTKGTSAWSDSSSGSSPTATAPQALEVLQSAQHVGGASSRTSVGVGGTPVGEILLPTMAGSGSKMSTPKRSPSREIPIVIAFDLETTGLSKEKNRIIEIAAVNVTDKTHQPMSTLINPGRFSIPHHITQLTGITNSMVRISHSPRSASAIAHTRTKREHYPDSLRNTHYERLTLPAFTIRCCTPYTRPWRSGACFCQSFACPWRSFCANRTFSPTR
jgi:hypothetical protein